MDILNWIYLKTAGLIRPKANNINTDTLVIGANVGPVQRGDSYLTYGMTLGDFKNDVINGNMVYEQGTFSPLAFTTDPMPYYGTGQVNFPGQPKNLIYRLVGFIQAPGFASSYSIKIGELATISPATPSLEIVVISNGSTVQEDGITGIGRAVSIMGPGAIVRNFATSASAILTTAYIRADNSVDPLVQEVFVELAGPVNFSCNVTLDLLVAVPEGYEFTWTR
jgi:hypothetical protein